MSITNVYSLLPGEVLEPGGPTGLGDYSPNLRVPFQAWNRLEGRPRTQSVDKSLVAEVYDPLWFFTRQWQMGELKGEDSGSAILAKVAYSATKPSHFSTQATADLQPIDNLHLPSAMQKMPVQLNVQQRAHLGSIFLKMCRAAGLTTATFLSDLCAIAAFPEFEISGTDSWVDEMQAVKFNADSKLVRYTSMYKNRVPDGSLVYAMFAQNETSFLALFSTLTPVAMADLKAKYNEVVLGLYPAIEIPAAESNWKPQDLGFEYRMGYPVETNNGVETLQLGNTLHTEAIADWFCADYVKHSNADVLAPVNSTSLQNYKREELFTVIPTSARFKGMPAKRWWEMEDAAINLGAAGGEFNEVVKQIVAEFATVYSNDWMVLPMRRKELELVNIKGVMVKDIFGEYTYVKNTLTGDESDTDARPYEWNLFHHERTFAPEQMSTNEPHASLHSSMVMGSARAIAKGEEIERVEFIRDEMDNRVWAVESTIADSVAGSRPGRVVSDELQQYLDKLVSDNANNTETPSDVLLQYRLANNVSEHYIPFVPVRCALNGGEIDGRSIELRRAWLPRKQSLFGEPESRIRPRTSVLRYRINDNDTPDATYPRYALKEELIPRSGLTITDRYCYARSADGKIHLWLSRNVKNGAEAGSAELGYDGVMNKNVK
jgi:hypothetical protein